MINVEYEACVIIECFVSHRKQRYSSERFKCYKDLISPVYLTHMCHTNQLVALALTAIIRVRGIQLWLP